MANTLTNLIPTMYKAADVVVRELTGFIPAVTLSASAEGVAKDQTVRYPVVAAETAADIAPAATGPDPADTSVGSDTMSISKSRSVTFHWNGEEQKGLGSMYDVILQDQFAQAMRTLVNEVETDLAALYIHASRAYGTAGTTPFASTLADPAQVRKILADNGAPLSDLQMVINTSAGAALRTLAQLNKLNESGPAGGELRERGTLLDLHGFSIRESAKVKNHTAGAGTGYLLNLTAGYAAGSTSFVLDTGSGTLLAGDILSNTKTGRDASKYVIPANGTTTLVTINKPGNLNAWVNNDPVAIGAAYAANMAFSRSAIHALLRTPLMPEGGDAADDVTIITDPQSGISFQVALYRQYRRVAIEVGLAWGVKAVKSEAMAILLG